MICKQTKQIKMKTYIREFQKIQNLSRDELAYRHFVDRYRTEGIFSIYESAIKYPKFEKIIGIVEQMKFTSFLEEFLQIYELLDFENDLKHRGFGPDSRPFEVYKQIKELALEEMKEIKKKKGEEN